MFNPYYGLFEYSAMYVLRLHLMRTNDNFQWWLHTSNQSQFGAVQRRTFELLLVHRQSNWHCALSWKTSWRLVFIVNGINGKTVTTFQHFSFVHSTKWCLARKSRYRILRASTLRKCTAHDLLDTSMRKNLLQILPLSANDKGFYTRRARDAMRYILCWWKCLWRGLNVINWKMDYAHYRLVLMSSNPAAPTLL